MNNPPFLFAEPCRKGPRGNAGVLLRRERVRSAAARGLRPDVPSVHRRVRFDGQTGRGLESCRNSRHPVQEEYRFLEVIGRLKAMDDLLCTYAPVCVCGGG